MLKRPKNLPKACKWTNRYKGVYRPRCSGGTGCSKCWDIYFSRREETETGVTDVVVILDRSGSMLTIRKPMEDGLRELINSQKYSTDTCYFTLVKFDHLYEISVNNVPIQDVHSCNLTLQPRGLTRLNDAIGKTIRHKEKQYLTELPPDKVLFYIITDGLENDSKIFSTYEIREMIWQCKEKGWQFTYLGEGGQEVGADLGFDHDKASTYSYSDVGTQGLFQTVINKVSTVRSASKDDDIEGLVSITSEDLARMNQ